MKSGKLRPRDFIDILVQEFGLKNQNQTAKFLGVTQGRVSQIKSSTSITKANLKKLLHGTFRAGKREARASISEKSSSDVFDILSIEFDLKTQKETAKFLGLTQGRISQIKKSKKLTKAILKTLVKATSNAGRKKVLKELNTAVLDMYGDIQALNTQHKVAKALKTTQPSVAQWKNGYFPLSRQALAIILKSASSVKIQKIIEMQEVEPKKPGGKWYLFHDAQKRKAFLEPLIGRSGIYCYFNSTGHLTYVGKADRTPLEKEIEARLNAKVSGERLPYGSNLKKHKKLRQGNIVEFVSAYDVHPKEAIPMLEALIIRTTANSQYNNRLRESSKDLSEMSKWIGLTHCSSSRNNGLREILLAVLSS